MSKNDYSKSAKYYDLILDPSRYKKNAAFIQKLLSKYKVKTSLELGCGSGLYTITLSKEFDIEGLDISKEMLLELKKQSKIQTYKQDMTVFSTNKKYDSILILNSSLTLVSTFAGMKRTIRQCKKHLNEGGLLVLDLPNHANEIKEGNFEQEVESYKLPGGKLDVLIRSFKKGNKWVEQWLGFGKQKNSFFEFKEEFEEIIFPVKEFEKAVKQDFKVLEMYGSREGKPFNKDSYRRVYVLRMK